MDPNYIGGARKSLRGGFQAPVPEIKIAGKKKQMKFKRKPGTAVAQLGNTMDKIMKSLGAPVGETIKQIKAKITKERTLFRANINKAGTHVKKAERRKGATIKKSKEEATRLKDAFKADLKKLIAYHTYLALKEFNANLR